MQGVGHIKPQIKKAEFEKKGFLSVYLKDGRVILVPLKFFPSLKKLTGAERKKYQIADDTTLVFFGCDEVYHVQDFLGLYEDYQYRFAS